MNEKRTVLYTVRLVGLRIDPLCHVKGEVWVLRGFRSCRVQYRQQPKKKRLPATDGRTDGDGRAQLKPPLAASFAAACSYRLSSLVRDARMRSERGGVAAVLHEREKRFYTLNGADKLSHMARVSGSPLFLFWSSFESIQTHYVIYRQTIVSLSFVPRRRSAPSASMLFLFLFLVRLISFTTFNDVAALSLYYIE
jgi:hypothetical protein